MTSSLSREVSVQTGSTVTPAPEVGEREEEGGRRREGGEREEEGEVRKNSEKSTTVMKPAQRYTLVLSFWLLQLI